jgi:hypothetical protein
MSERAGALYRSQFVAEHVYSNMHAYLNDVVASFSPVREVVPAA